MKLREIVEKTGISKRNIHFYIKEGLLHPAVAPGSGYYEFSEEEEKRLLLIREYRNAGLPLAVIRSLLDQPSTAGFFLTWQVIRLKQQAASCKRILSGLEQILDELPLHPDLDMLSSVTSGAGIPDAAGQPFPDAGSDAILLVNRFLWNQFLPDGLVTEYQKYLWDKLNRTAEKLCPEDYAVLFSSLQSLTLTQMGRMLSQRSAHYDRIVSLREEECEDYAREIQKGLISFLENDALLSFWKKNYARFFLPEVRIFSSRLSDIVAEISPFFRSYQEHINASCRILYRWYTSPEAASLRRCISENLRGYFDPELYRHGLFEALYSAGELMNRIT
jgi:DNA-binding transcriptional MerR regulator